MTLKEQRTLAACAVAGLAIAALTFAAIARKGQEDIESTNKPIIEAISKRGDLPEIKERFGDSNKVIDAAMQRRQ